MAGSPGGVTIELLDGMHFVAQGHDGVTVDMDASEEHGGRGKGFRPMEMLLVGLGGCTGMDVVSVLRKMRQTVTGYRIQVSGVQRPEHPHIFTHITITHILEGNDLSEDSVQRAIELSETKYCSAYAMLKESAEITSSFEIHSAVPAD
jgi:putative redox protein